MTADPVGAVPWLRVEGLAFGLASVLGYALLSGHDWLFFALIFLVPDVSMLGYLAGPRAGAAVYNAAHTYVGPLLLGTIGVMTGATSAVAIALIWSAHIGFDRCLGYGLKLSGGFQQTHLGRIGGSRHVSHP